MKKRYFKSLLSLLLVAGALSSSAQNALVNAKVKSLEKGAVSKSKSGSRKAVDATLVCKTAYVAGTTMNLDFELTLLNQDDEYGDSLSITFPAGFTPVVSTNDPLFDMSSVPDAVPLAYNGVNGATITWGDNNDTYGGAPSGGVLIAFTISTTINSGVTGQHTGNFFVSGDTYGPSPADFSGTFVLSDQAAPADLQALLFSPFLTAYTPVKHAAPTQLIGAVINNGSDLSENVDFTFSATPNTFSEIVEVEAPLASGDFQILLTTGNYTPAMGLNTVIGDATYAEDADNTDNADTATFNVTTNYFSYNAGDVNTAAILGIGAVGSLGYRIDLATVDTLDKVNAYHAKPAMGGSVSVSIYAYDADSSKVGALIATGTPHVFADSAAQYVDYEFDNLVLQEGSYLVAFNELVAGKNMGLGSTFDGFATSTHYVKIGAGAWNDLNNYSAGFHRTLYTKAIFGSAGGNGINEALAKTINVGPNPSNGMVTVNGVNNANVTVMDNLGRVVAVKEISAANNTINVSELSTGNYNLHITTAEGTAVKKISVIK